MKKVFFVLAMGAFLTMPCILRAEEVIISLHEVVYLYSISGHLIAETTQSEIDMDQLTSGVYILRVMTTDGQLLQSKFIKQ